MDLGCRLHKEVTLSWIQLELPLWAVTINCNVTCCQTYWEEYFSRESLLNRLSQMVLLAKWTIVNDDKLL